MTAMSLPPAAPQHESHGNTPAAWTTVTIVMVAFTVGTLALVIDNWPMFWVGAGLLVVAVIVGKVMAMAGLGKKPADAHAHAASSDLSPSA